MKYRIRYSPAAMNDMDSVWDDVLEASASYDIADRYVDEFADAIAEKAEFPESGIPLSYRGLFTGFYSVNFKAYKAFYRIKDGFVEITRILLAKMDYLKILFDTNEV